MESKVEAEAVQLAGKKKSTFPSSAADDGRVEAASMGIMASSPSAASPAAIVSAFLAPPLSLLRHVASLCAGYLGLDGGLKPPAAAAPPASSSSSAAAAATSQRGEVVDVEAAASVEDYCAAEVVLAIEVRSRGFTPPQRRSAPRESKIAAVGGVIH
ncbi:uncharacterized protein [Zea mays]|uniref:Uncharacterized protein n=1 Tax=Zea mays TaxID=4577 RepID=K7U068_MAIZE|nr:uncharacterized protein LOC103641207 [Zea mays]AQK41208.1 hypothetical protein ZEAMMB73_Zm00001d024437 [Zea mays]|eukprot:XP_008662794.1 uncharacterized protein LOC103641207 [Zea mays]